MYRRGDILTFSDDKPGIVIGRAGREWRVAREDGITKVEFHPNTVIVSSDNATRLVDELEKIANAISCNNAGVADLVFSIWKKASLDDRGRLSAESKWLLMETFEGSQYEDEVRNALRLHALQLMEDSLCSE